ncbi:hypothetical protein N431DRAFT_331518 [Stipitochalara longipes BDJ]|nr:hypothetical protein N431DRAFT_331518 [Stipitochalara longipes BDJ]
MPLQKSFSDQNHSAKLKQQHRPQWTRNKSFQGPQQNNPNPWPLQEKPPVPVSTVTKNKLSNFQFHGRPSEITKAKAVISLLSDDEKENEGAKYKKADEMPQEDPKSASPEQPKLPEQVPKDVPTTPAGRLALKDLIGMGDIRREVQNISPEERIEWNHEKDMLPGSGSAFGGIRKARKRARSSSPTGSPSAQASPHFDPKFESTNPKVDPGSELWGRYSLNGSNVPTPQGPSIPALAHLMHTSSPQPSKDGMAPRSTSGFRRANSCGNQFPKRRRIGGCEGDDVFTESTTIGPSKLAVLIERVQEGLAPKHIPASTVSSESLYSPVDRLSSQIGDVKKVDCNNSTEYKAASDIRLQKNEAVKSKTDSSVPPKVVKAEVPGSSDYGDFDDDELDESLMEIIVENTMTTPQIHQNPPPQNHPEKSQSGPPPQVNAAESFESGTLKGEFDEFDEFDDPDEDLFAADLENIASQFDTKARGNSKTMLVGGAGAPRQRKTLTRTKSESEDEFGDCGLDDLDFEAAEATATQAIQKTANSLLPVRTRFL